MTAAIQAQERQARDSSERVGAFSMATKSATNRPVEINAGEATRQLLKAMNFYRDQFHRCHKANAWLAAAAMGAACCESALLLMCLRFEGEIKSNGSLDFIKPDDYLRWLFSRGVGLEKLCKIALAMKWITSEDISSESSRFCQDLIYSSVKSRPGESKKLDWAVNVVLDVGLSDFVMYIVKTTRNLIHPGKCVRENAPISGFASEEAKPLAVIWCDIVVCLHAYIKRTDHPDLSKGAGALRQALDS